MDPIPEDVLKRTFRLIYDTYFEQKLAEELLNMWGRVDLVSSVLIALSTTGSAIAGWGVWKTQSGIVIWALISGTAAFLAIVNSAVQIPEKVRTQTNLSVTFRDLEWRAENLYDSLPSITASQAERQISALTKIYRTTLSRAPKDLLMTERWSDRIQRKTNAKMVERGYYNELPASLT